MSRPGDLSDLSEADLHGLVDNRIDSIRRTELGRRLKSHPAERRRIDNWREQNDLIKATFSEVENEILPVALDLTPPPRLHCVVSDGRPIALRQDPSPAKGRVSDARRSRLSLVMLTTLAVAVGIAALWIALDPRRASQPPIKAAVAEQIDAMVTARTLEVLGQVEARPSVRLPSSATRVLATRLIPDLSDQGFGFIGATARADAPETLIFLYQNGAADRLVLGVARIERNEAAEAAIRNAGDHAVSWHRHGKRFTLAGVMPMERLRAVATGLATERETADGD